MTLRSLPSRFLLGATVAFGLSACDTGSVDTPATSVAETAAFEAAVLPELDRIVTVRNTPDDQNRDRVFFHDSELGRATRLSDERRLGNVLPGELLSIQQITFGLLDNGAQGGPQTFFGTFDMESGGAAAQFARNGSLVGVSPVGALVAPKGIDVDYGATNLAVVADFGAATLPVFDSGDFEAGPVFSLNVTGEGSVWDADIDVNTGLVFVAKTNGRVAVYNIDDAAFGGVFDPIDEFQVMGADGSPAVNNHGIVFDSNINFFDPEASNSGTLIVSDVGQAGSPTDGAFHILDYDLDARLGEGEGGPDANTPLMARVTYAGSNTQLGNPVDIEGSGDDLFVAEKANGGGFVLRFDGVFDIDGSGMRNLAPDASIVVANAESVASFDPNPTVPFEGGPFPGPTPTLTSNVDTGNATQAVATERTRRWLRRR